jgi:hypothetical protein
VYETLHDHLQEPPLKPVTFRNFSIGIGISIMGGVREISFSENRNELVDYVFASTILCKKRYRLSNITPIV